MNATIVGDRIRLKFRYHPPTIELVKTIPGRTWHTEAREWSIPATEHAAKLACDLFGLDPDVFSTLLPQSPAVLTPVSDEVQAIRWGQPPYAHQRSGLAELLGHPEWLLAWEMGVGKTAPTAVAIREKLAAGEGLALVACPKSLIATWGSEFMKHAGITSVGIMESTRDERKRLIAHAVARNLPVIANYEQVTHGFAEFEKVRWGIVVADECQRIKNASSQRSKSLRALGASAKHRWALSGTPAPNGPLDWFGVLLFLDPTGRVAGTRSKRMFEETYGVRGQAVATAGGGMFKPIVGYKNLDDLRARVARVSSRLKKDQCLDLPEKIFQTRRVALEGEQARIYKTLRNEAVVRLKRQQEDSTLTAANILTEHLRLLQVVGGYVPDDNGQVHEINPNAKMLALEELIDEIGDQQCIIWCGFLAEVSAAARLLGERTAVLTGQVDQQDRDRAVREFQAGDRQFLTGTAETGGVGLTLTAASQMVFYSRKYSLEHWLQACDRAHRIGQTKNVVITSLVCDGTIDEKVAGALERKERFQERLLATADIEELF